MSRENTTEGTTTPISPAGAKRINYTRLAEVESPVKGLNSRVVLIAYEKGGEDFELGILDRVTMPIDFGLQ